MEAKRATDEALRNVKMFQPRDNIVFGSIEKEQLNAATTYLGSSSGYLIVFNRGVLMALLAASSPLHWRSIPCSGFRSD